jgi:hypothetical protein
LHTGKHNALHKTSEPIAISRERGKKSTSEVGNKSLSISILLAEDFATMICIRLLCLGL